MFLCNVALFFQTKAVFVTSKGNHAGGGIAFLFRESPNTHAWREGPKLPFYNPENGGRHLHDHVAKVTQGVCDAAGP